MKVFIYGLFDFETDTLRYIGKTEDPRRRFNNHLAGRTAATAGWANTTDVYLKILAQVPKAQAEFSEASFIFHALQEGAPLLNKEIP